jgi:hypothetical protein
LPERCNHLITPIHIFFFLFSFFFFLFFPHVLCLYG